MDNYLTAKVIILKSLKSGKLLTEYKLWDNLDYHAKTQALKDSFSRCDACYQSFHNSELQIAESNMYGTFYNCKNCISKRSYL